MSFPPLKSGMTHAQWRSWVEALIAVHMPITDDKNSVLLLTMVSLEHFSKILKKSDQTLVLLNNSFRRMLREVAEKDHGKLHVDAIMAIFDSWPSPFKAPFCTRAEDHPKFPAVTRVKTEGKDEGGDSAIMLQRLKQLESSLTVLNASMNAHACMTINRHLDDMLAEKLTMHEDPHALLSAIKELR
jgi:hypothetical protein